MDNRCRYAKDNKFPGEPAKMSDGRTFTNYNENYIINSKVQTHNNMKSNYDYRQFLTHNAVSLMKLNKNQAYTKNGVSSCATARGGTLVPERIVQHCDTQSCSYTVENNNGFGIGRANTRSSNPDPVPCSDDHNLSSCVNNNNNNINVSAEPFCDHSSHSRGSSCRKYPYAN